MISSNPFKRDKNSNKGDLGFEKHESSFEELVETVNLRWLDQVFL